MDRRWFENQRPPKHRKLVDFVESLEDSGLVVRPRISDGKGFVDVVMPLFKLPNANNFTAAGNFNISGVNINVEYTNLDIPATEEKVKVKLSPKFKTEEGVKVEMFIEKTDIPAHIIKPKNIKQASIGGRVGAFGLQGGFKLVTSRVGNEETGYRVIPGIQLEAQVGMTQYTMAIKLEDGNVVLDFPVGTHVPSLSNVASFLPISPPFVPSVSSAEFPKYIGLKKNGVIGGVSTIDELSGTTIKIGTPFCKQ